MAVISKLDLDGKNIIKYNNATISNINFNGTDYHFAKPNLVEGGECTDAVEEPIIDMDVYGNTIKNLYPGYSRENFAALSPYVTLENNVFSIDYTNSGSERTWPAFLTKPDTSLITPGKTYTYVLEILNWEGSATSFSIGDTWSDRPDSRAQLSYESVIVERGKTYFFTLTGTDAEKYLFLSRDYIQIDPGQTAKGSWRVSLYEGVMTEEEFTRNGYIAPIGHNISGVGDRTKNILEITEKFPYTNEGLTVSRNSNGSINISGVAKKGASLYLSRNINFILKKGTYTINSTGVNSIDVYLLPTYQKGTFTINSDTIYTGCYIYVPPEFVGQPLDFSFYPQIEEGSSFTGYEPYGYRIPVKVSGKNILNKSESSIQGIRDESPFSAWATIAFNNQWVIANLKPSTTYTISYDVTGVSIPTYTDTYSRGIGFVLYSGISDNVRIALDSRRYLNKDETIHIAKTFTTPTTLHNTSANYRLLAYTNRYLNDSVGVMSTMIFSNVQIEEGDKETSFEPYIEPITTNIYLDEPLRKIGDYADYIDFENKIVVRNIAFKNLMNNSWSKYVSVENHFQTSVGNNYFNINENYIISNYYPTNKENGAYYSVKDYAVMSVDGGRIRFKNKDCSTLEEWEKYLDTLTTPLCVIYRLATPVEEKIDLPAIETIKGTNIFEIQTTTQPSKLSVEYWKQI